MTALEFFFATLEAAFQIASPDEYGYIKAYVYLGAKGEEVPCMAADTREEPASPLRPSFDVRNLEGPKIEAVGGGKTIDFPSSCHSFDVFTIYPVEIVTIAYSISLETLLGIGCSTNSGWGVTVDSISPNSRASEAGLKPGDIISQAQGININSCEQLLEIVSGVALRNYLILRVHRSSGVVPIQIVM